MISISTAKSIRIGPADSFEYTRGKGTDVFHIKKSRCIFFKWIHWVILLWFTIPNPALADNIRPAYLEIEELASGNIRVVWKVPLGQGIPSHFKPSFPKHFRIVPPRKNLKTNDAIVETWHMMVGDNGLVGAQIGIDGLEQTTTDALVRIRLFDGSTHRVVLRPSERSTMIPDPHKSEKATIKFQSGLLRFIDHWRYGFLLAIGLVLSFLPMARRRGIAVCTVALVCGSICGYAIGGLTVPDKGFRPDSPSKAETAKILQGLLLNTYRAFMLQEDEDIYDVLARSVSGDFLGEVYLQNREKMRMSESDGTMAIVHQLDIKSINSIDRNKDGSISMVAHWDVYGSVHHQRHVHYRCNTYTAEVTIEPTDTYWKLEKIQLLDEQRVL